MTNIVEVLLEESDMKDILLNVSVTVGIASILLLLSVLRFRKRDI